MTAQERREAYLRAKGSAPDPEPERRLVRRRPSSRAIARRRMAGDPIPIPASRFGADETTPHNVSQAIAMLRSLPEYSYGLVSREVGRAETVYVLEWRRVWIGDLPEFGLVIRTRDEARFLSAVAELTAPRIERTAMLVVGSR